MPGFKNKMLLICPKFHGYEQEISKAFKRNGLTVDLLLYDEHKLIRYNFYRFPLVISALIFNKLFSKNYKYIKSLDRLKEWAKDYKPFYSEMIRLLAQKKGNKYDWALIIKGYGWDRSLFNNLRQHVDGPIALYQWDPVSRFPSLQKVYPLFDFIFVFQSQDAKKIPNATYLPSFYVPTYEILKNNKKNKIAFFGYYSNERYKILNELAGYCNKFGILTDFTLVIRFPVVHFDKNNAVKIRKNFLNRNDVEKKYCDSKAIVDIPKPHQHGLTQRVYEALAAKRKVITYANNHEEWPVSDKDWIISVSQFYKTGLKWLSKEPDGGIDISEFSIDCWARRILKKIKYFNSSVVSN